MRICLFLFTLILLTSCGTKKTDLGLKLEKGKTYRQSMASDLTIKQTINGTEVPIGVKIDGLMAYTVKSIEGKNYNLEVVYKSLDMTMQTPAGALDFSSEKRDNKDVVSTMLSEMKNRPFSIKMSSEGKVLEVTNMENLIAGIFTKYPGMPEAQKQQLHEQLSKSFGAEALKGNLEMTMAIFPKDPVAPGETWVVHSFLASNLKANVRTTYTYEGSDSGYHKIRGDATLESADQAFTEVNGVPTKYDLQGTVKSNIKVDKNTGWIITANVNQEVSGDTYVRTVDHPAGFRVPMQMKNTMVIRNN